MIYPIGGCSTHPIIHVAVADVDATYGAYVTAENNTLDDMNNNGNNANYMNNYANCDSNNAHPNGKRRQ